MALPMYVSNDAAKITYDNLSQSLKHNLTENDIYTILEMKFLADDEDTSQIARMCIKMGIEIAPETVKEILKAEEVYLHQIGVM